MFCPIANDRCRECICTFWNIERKTCEIKLSFEGMKMIGSIVDALTSPNYENSMSLNIRKN